MKRHLHRPVGKILALSFLMSCSVKAVPSDARPISSGKQTYSVIKSDELRQILDNVVVSKADDDGRDPTNFKEVFYSNGEYGRIMSRPMLGKMMGHFEIEADHYCVIIGIYEDCFNLLRSSDGKIFGELIFDKRFNWSPKIIRLNIRKVH